MCVCCVVFCSYSSTENTSRKRAMLPPTIVLVVVRDSALAFARLALPLHLGLRGDPGHAL